MIINQRSDPVIFNFSLGPNTKEGIFSCQVRQCSGDTNLIVFKARATKWQLEGRGVAPSLILWGQRDVRISRTQIAPHYDSFEVNSLNYQSFNHFGGKLNLGDTIRDFADD